MKPVRLILAIGIAALLSACGAADYTSRNAPFETTEPVLEFAATGPSGFDFEEAVSSYNVTRVNVTVPRSLIVSEANRYYPKGDIVWREDPVGDRHAQVAAIFEDAMARGTSDVKGAVPVVVDVQVLRFHALTEKTRYTVGGIHSIKFGLSIRSAETGLLLEKPRVVQADLVGFGGQKAINAMAQGQTQKVRITDHLANVIRKELTEPEGYENPKLGLIQTLNNRI
ncbi:DUF6778 family protein [Roseobacter sp.]|uniref:DUF6778 family protein n=1 Tax=Roseobacter sp. TaxID=1907202 RepID=UPI0025D69DC8|nr:DUF6778 family protein [Roseobacter sp.]